MSRELTVAGITAPELCASFELCEQVVRRGLPDAHLGTMLLPAPKRPYMHALFGFFVAADDCADKGPLPDRVREFGRWREDTLRELRLGHSDHPLRRAVLHTVQVWGIDVRALEKLLAALAGDIRDPVEFTTFSDLRMYLDGVTGAFLSSLVPLLEPRGRPSEVVRLMSLLGAAAQLIDIFRDYPADLAQRKIYVSQDDLRDFGLTPDDLVAATRRLELGGLLARQVDRCRALLADAGPVVELVHPSSRPYLEAAFLHAYGYLHEVTRRGSEVFAKETVLPLPTISPELLLSLPPSVSRTRADRTASPGRLRRVISGLLTRRRAIEQLPEALPRHIAVIMDGNRRWAAERGLFVLDGHTAGRQTMVEMIDNILEIGVGHLSLFAFSTENWDRSEEEVSGLLTLLARTINEYVVDWHAKRVRLRWLGRRDRIPAELRTELESAERLTADNQRLNLSICLDYGGRDEIVRAAARLAASHIDPGSVTEKSFSEFLDEPTLPDVDLLIRTSGEQRTSNFMPWQAAYAELVFLPAHWPAFTREHLHEAVAEYGRRERRFGGNRRNLVAG